MLDAQALKNKQFAALIAAAAKLRLDDWGDFMGMVSPRTRKPANQILVDMHLSATEFGRCFKVL